jgi:esterase
MSEPSEFDVLAEAAGELELDTAAVPPVSREFLQLPGGQQISYLRWGTSEPELVLLHGGGQNAHTWDLVLLLLGRPAIAIDLPGHGHSDWRPDRDYGPLRNAEAIAAVVEQRAPDAEAAVGMSLGGLTLIHLAATRPDLVRQTVLVDVAPGSAQAVAAMTARDRGTVELSFGPRVYASREEMIDAAVASSPRRPASAVRRGVIHNSKQLPDGSWAWRYDRSEHGLDFPVADLWTDVSRFTMPTMVVTGGESGFVTPDDRAEYARRLPHIRLETVAGAGHAVQSDQPVALTALITDFLRPRPS